MKMIAVFIFILIAKMSNSIKMTLFLKEEDGPTCFYSQLKQGQKYLVTVFTQSHQKCHLSIYKQNGSSWETVVAKELEKSFQTISKLSTSQSTYMFCYTNTDKSILKITTQILSGLQMANFEYLPDTNDNQQLQYTIQYVQSSKDKLLETINRLQGTQVQTQNLQSSSGRTMILMAIGGLLVIIANNIFFYLNAKKQLKDRKLI